VQEAGLNKILGLVSKMDGPAEANPATQGLASGTSTQIVVDAMSSWVQDAEIQKTGCKAIACIMKQKGDLFTVLQKGAASATVKAIQAHITDSTVCGSATIALSSLMLKITAQSPEHGMIQAAGTEQALLDIVSHHPLEHQLDKRARQLIPFVRPA